MPVIGYQTEELPAFYTRKSGFKVDYRMDTPAEIAEAFRAKMELGLDGSMLVTNPIPRSTRWITMPSTRSLMRPLPKAKELGIHGKETTPYLLDEIQKITGGDSLEANIRLVYNNARLASAIAVELSR